MSLTKKRYRVLWFPGYRLSHFIPVLLLLLAGMHTRAQSTPVPAAVGAYIDSLQKAGGFPGMAVTIKWGKSDYYTLATGESDTSRHLPMKAGAVMPAGAAAQMFYATTVMLLAKEGLLALDSPIQQYLGKTAIPENLPFTHKITLRQLLNHTSALPEYYRSPDFLKELRETPFKNRSREEMLSYVPELPPFVLPGERFNYAYTNYLLVGRVIECALQKDIRNIVVEKIITPLRLHKTTITDTLPVKNLAVGYTVPGNIFGLSGPTSIGGKFLFHPGYEIGPGGFTTNTADLALFLYTLMHGGITDSAALRAMQKGVKAFTGTNHQYGLGLQIRPYAYGKGYGHGGWFPGYATEVEYFPEKDLVVAIQVNTDNIKLLNGNLRQHVLKIMQIISSNSKI